MPVVRRWLWLVVLLTVSAPLVLAFKLQPSYTASTRIQITAPPSVDVALFQGAEPYRNLRDDLTVARVDFIEAARSPEVRARTVATLGLGEADEQYSLDVKQVRDSDFVDLSVASRTAELAERIANTHAELAIAYASELRALPARALVVFLSNRITSAELELSRTSSASAPVARLAQDNYDVLHTKLAEAQLKASEGYSAQSMQIVAQAPVPRTADNHRVQALLLLSVVGSLAVGVALAFVLDAIAPRAQAIVWRTYASRAGARF